MNPFHPLFSSLAASRQDAFFDKPSPESSLPLQAMKFNASTLATNVDTVSHAHEDYTDCTDCTATATGAAAPGSPPVILFVPVASFAGDLGAAAYSGAAAESDFVNLSFSAQVFSSCSTVLSSSQAVAAAAGTGATVAHKDHVRSRCKPSTRAAAAAVRHITNTTTVPALQDREREREEGTGRLLSAAASRKLSQKRTPFESLLCVSLTESAGPPLHLSETGGAGMASFAHAPHRRAQMTASRGVSGGVQSATIAATGADSGSQQQRAARRSAQSDAAISIRTISSACNLNAEAEDAKWSSHSGSRRAVADVYAEEATAARGSGAAAVPANGMGRGAERSRSANSVAYESFGVCPIVAKPHYRLSPFQWVRTSSPTRRGSATRAHSGSRRPCGSVSSTSPPIAAKRRRSSNAGQTSDAAKSPTDPLSPTASFTDRPSASMAAADASRWFSLPCVLPTSAGFPVTPRHASPYPKPKGRRKQIPVGAAPAGGDHGPRHPNGLPGAPQLAPAARPMPTTAGATGSGRKTTDTATTTAPHEACPRCPGWRRGSRMESVAGNSSSSGGGGYGPRGRGTLALPSVTGPMPRFGMASFSSLPSAPQWDGRGRRATESVSSRLRAAVIPGAAFPVAVEDGGGVPVSQKLSSGFTHCEGGGAGAGASLRQGTTGTTFCAVPQGSSGRPATQRSAWSTLTLGVVESGPVTEASESFFTRVSALSPTVVAPAAEVERECAAVSDTKDQPPAGGGSAAANTTSSLPQAASPAAKALSGASTSTTSQRLPRRSSSTGPTNEVVFGGEAGGLLCEFHPRSSLHRRGDGREPSRRSVANSISGGAYHADAAAAMLLTTVSTDSFSAFYVDDDTSMPSPPSPTHGGGRWLAQRRSGHHPSATANAITATVARRSASSKSQTDSSSGPNPPVRHKSKSRAKGVSHRDDGVDNSCGAAPGSGKTNVGGSSHHAPRLPGRYHTHNETFDLRDVDHCSPLQSVRHSPAAAAISVSRREDSVDASKGQDVDDLIELLPVSSSISGDLQMPMPLRARYFRFQPTASGACIPGMSWSTSLASQGRKGPPRGVMKVFNGFDATLVSISAASSAGADFLRSGTSASSQAQPLSKPAQVVVPIAKQGTETPTDSGVVADAEQKLLCSNGCFFFSAIPVNGASPSSLLDDAEHQRRHTHYTLIRSRRRALPAAELEECVALANGGTVADTPLVGYQLARMSAVRSVSSTSRYSSATQEGTAPAIIGAYAPLSLAMLSTVQVSARKGSSLRHKTVSAETADSTAERAAASGTTMVTAAAIAAAATIMTAAK